MKHVLFLLLFIFPTRTYRLLVFFILPPFPSISSLDSDMKIVVCFRSQFLISLYIIIINIMNFIENKINYIRKHK